VFFSLSRVPRLIVVIDDSVHFLATITTTILLSLFESQYSVPSMTVTVTAAEQPKGKEEYAGASIAW
jgi:hypothetical protein